MLTGIRLIHVVPCFASRLTKDLCQSLIQHIFCILSFQIQKITTSTSTYEGGPTMDSHTIIHSGKESVKIEGFLKIYLIEQW